MNRFYFGFIFICTLGALIFAPQSARGQLRFPEGPIDFMVPQFVVEAVNFKAIDESGYDRFGSDEVYAVFSDLNPTLIDAITKTYGDVDTGETRAFRSNERCIAPRPRCDHGVSEILHFQVSFWEEDVPPFSDFQYGTRPGDHTQLQHGKRGDDDLIGRGEVLMSREELLAELPRVGDSVEHKLILGGPCGYHPADELVACGGPAPTGPEYELTYRITRLDDVRRPLVMAPPRLR